ncbi:MAG: 50S ribosomal protein L24 [Alphaproteobacteria bacterium CG_4_9_14_3_um_filter_47_13]|nr:MAG: 50S ribosomal protein L24 [Alphaproteobacteria bacterium CG_4_9_14_3_um_filter_47_13]
MTDKIKLKIKKGDTVIVLTGKDKGVKGEILQTMPQERRVLVQGVNIAKKHRKPTQANPNGGIESIEKTIHISNVALLDPKEDKPTRIGYKTLKDGKKVRVAKRSGETIE